MAIRACAWLICSSRAKQPCRVGIDPVDFGSFVGDRHLDQLVKLRVDAALEQRDQPGPGDVRAAAAPQLFDLAKLIERVLKLLLDGGEPLDLGGFDSALGGRRHGKLSFRETLQLLEIGFDHLGKIGRPQGTVAHAGK